VLAQNNEVYRVNSLTLAIDDYTATFSAYNNLQLIDIAGRSMDTVFIATNSTNVIEYEKGNIRLIGSSDGIPGTVNSVGISGNKISNTLNTHYDLMIGTNQGFRYYDPKTETFAGQNDNGDSRIYEATWRTEMYKDSSAQTSDFETGDTIQYQPVVFRPDDGATYISYLWEGGKEFGYNINTAVSIYDDIYTPNGVFTDLFWGNSRGMFQNYSDYSYYSIYFPGIHYLNGIGVNKITSIYGLAAFGDQNTHQNLLVGTDNGFYFSSNIYTYGPVYMRTLSLFYDSGLGNIVINDICVNAASTNQPICEDGVWLGANDGLYLIKPDYATYLNSQTLHAISFKNQPDTLSHLKLCSGDSALAVINTSGYSGNSIQWYQNGNELPAQSKDTLIIKTAGDYYALLYDPCEDIHMESNHLKVQIITNPVFSFNYPAAMQLCYNTPDTLKTTNTPGYHYQWYTNDVLNGDTAASFVVTQTGKYKVEVSACPNSWVPSKEVQITLVQLPVLVIAADKPTYCIGDNATLSIAIPADPSYTINWFRDNLPLTANNNLNTLTTNAAGNYTVSIVNNTVNTDGTICSQTSAVQSISFNPMPTVSIEKIVKTTICDGQTVDLLAHYSGGSVMYLGRY